LFGECLDTTIIIFRFAWDGSWSHLGCSYSLLQPLFLKMCNYFIVPPKIAQLLASCFILMYQCTKNIHDFLLHIDYTTKLIQNDIEFKANHRPHCLCLVRVHKYFQGSIHGTKAQASTPIQLITLESKFQSMDRVFIAWNRDFISNEGTV